MIVVHVLTNIKCCLPARSVSPEEEEKKAGGAGFEGKFFEGLGTGQDVPKFLKFKGKVRRMRQTNRTLLA